jgi:hypothetical protein
MPAEKFFADSTAEVGRKGKIAAMKTFGRAVQSGVEKPATNETVFVAMSATKAITVSPMASPSGRKIQSCRQDHQVRAGVRDQRQGVHDDRASPDSHRRHSGCAGLLQGLGRSQAASGALRAVASRESAGREVYTRTTGRLGMRSSASRGSASASSCVNESRSLSDCPICESDCRARSNSGWPK